MLAALLAILNSVVKGVVELVKQFAIPLAAFSFGKKSQELKRLKREVKSGKESEKIRDGVKRSSDSDIDDVLHD